MSLNEWKNNELNGLLLKKFGILSEGKKKGKYDDGDGKDEKCDYVDCGDKDKSEKSKDDKKKGSKPEKGKVPPQFKKDDEDMDESHCMEEGHCTDRDKLKEEDLEEGRNNPRTTNADKFVGHEDRYQADRIHEGEGMDTESQYRRMEMLRMKKDLTPEEHKELLELMQSFQMMRESNNKLQESIRRIAKAKKVFLNGKRIQ